MFRTLLKRAAHLRVALANGEAAGFRVTGFVNEDGVKKKKEARKGRCGGEHPWDGSWIRLQKRRKL